MLSAALDLLPTLLRTLVVALAVPLAIGLGLQELAYRLGQRGAGSATDSLRFAP